MGVFRVSSSNSSMITGGQSSSRQGHKFHGRVWVEVGVESRGYVCCIAPLPCEVSVISCDHGSTCGRSVMSDALQEDGVAGQRGGGDTSVTSAAQVMW
jgi:hypothetical protein